MGTPTNTYVDPAAGNDHAGASFTDGSFANASNTLTKSGAFPATTCKVGASLYIEDNGSGEVTAGYYSVATRTDDDNVVLSADIRSGVNDPTDVKCTLHDGTSALPWKTVQFALNYIPRDATNGDQINVKSDQAIGVTTTTDDVLSAGLDVTTNYGTPTNETPLIIRGYTSAVNDGGIGGIDCGGSNGLFAATTYDYIHLIDLHLHNSGSTNVVDLDVSCSVRRCEVDTSTASGIVISGQYSVIEECHVHGVDVNGIYAHDNHQVIANNYVSGTPSLAINPVGAYGAIVVGNILSLGAGAGNGIDAYHGQRIERNSILSAAGSGYGISLGSLANVNVLNNTVEGFTSGSGKGIVDPGGKTAAIVAHNAVYNCVDEYSLDDTVFINDNETLSSSPFAKSGSDTFANRFTYFAPRDVGNLRGGAYPSGCRLDKGAVQHADSVILGRAYGQATLAKETGAGARGGSGSCIKLTADSTDDYGYVDFLVYVSGNESELSFYYKSFHTTTAWNGTLKMSWWDSDDPEEDPPPLLESVDISGTYDETWRQYTSAAKTPTAEGLCRIRFEILDGSDSGGVYIDDIAITDT